MTFIKLNNQFNNTVYINLKHIYKIKSESDDSANSWHKSIVYGPDGRDFIRQTPEEILKLCKTEYNLDNNDKKFNLRA